MSVYSSRVRNPWWAEIGSQNRLALLYHKARSEMKIKVTMVVEVEANSPEEAESTLLDALVGNDDVCDVEAALDAVDFESIEMTSEVVDFSSASGGC